MTVEAKMMMLMIHYVPHESHDNDGDNDDAEDDADDDDDDDGWVCQGGILFAKQRFKGAKLH